ncbi:hypothetical protein AB0J42_21465 [Nonomuraea sp. NPDC049649]|uniref:TolB family protein n=1 Tax=Nonomuraea sp. NPDC049649 TaxID=3155776 RepID=UPI0034198A74
MTPDVEELLRRTLGHAAGRSPGLPDGTAQAVEHRYRRRRQRSQALLAAAAVVLVAGGVTTGLRAADRAAPATGPHGSTPDPARTASAALSPEASPTTFAARPEPIEKVWPQALHEVPAKTPEGKRIIPILLLDDRTLLVSTWASMEKTDALYTYDLETLALRKITDVVTPKGTALFASGFDAEGGQVAWWTKLKDGTAQIWAAPLAGGEAKLIGSRVIDGGGLDKIEIAGHRVVFSARSGGVFTVPLAGGEPEPVDGAADMHLLSWPWIGAPGPYGQDRGARYERIRNVETGETDRALVRDGEQVHACGVRLCIGTSGRTSHYYRLRDGSRQRELPGVTPMLVPALDRFHVALLHYGDDSVEAALFDLQTGTAASLGVGAERTDGGFSFTMPAVGDDERLLAYELGGTLRVVDLTKIT